MTDDRALTAIRSDALSAEIDPLGAQLFSLRTADGADLLWSGDPAWWNGRAPLLFPIVGALEGGQYRLGDKTYALAKHGFARRSLFSWVETTESSVVFRLAANPETLATYPFDFELDLKFSLSGSTLTMRASVRNLGEVSMPASFGFHPALRWPMPFGQPRAEHSLEFEKDEPAPIRRINPDGVVIAEGFPTPVQGDRLELIDDLFVNDALIFDALRSQKLRYGGKDGPHLEVAFPDTPYLGIWTRPGAGFICIEPWHGIADPAGFDGDIRTKPGIFEVAPGSTYDIAMSITLRP
jgi:galactose mutarotase-like enzyme